MRFIDMSDYPPGARAYWFTLVGLGGAALGTALFQVAAMPAASIGRVLAIVLVTGIVALFPVKVSTRVIKVSISGGDIFVFLGLLLHGPAAATLIAAAEASVGSLLVSKRATSRLSSPAMAAVSMTLLGTLFWRVEPALGDMPDAAAMLALVLVTAFLYTYLELTLLRTIFVLKDRRNWFTFEWIRDYAWYAVFCCASASVAGVLYLSEQRSGIEALMVAAPLVATFVGAGHYYFEKKRADEQHMVELVESERRLQEALRVAENASRAKTRFLAAASHDLRQPLHALSFLTAALGMRPLDAPSREIAHKMSDALEDLAVEFDALLDISKLDAGLVAVAPSTFEVRPFLDRVVHPFVAPARAKRLSLEVSGEPGTFIHTDRALLERIVRNLVDNAVKYTPQGGVHVECRVREACCRIEVRDTGIGIPSAEHEHVFEEFYQIGNPERDRRKGMGLGLSIVRRLAGLLGAKLAMVSIAGRGTRFSLEFDLAAAPAQEDSRPVAGPLELRERQVLVIDDEAGPRDALRGYLEGLGCIVDVAGTVAEAAALAMLQEPDIVVADFRLRDAETGLDAIRRLRGSRPGLPAIIVTGDTAPERLAELDGTGIEILHKPVVPARLVESMVQQLARAAAAQANTLESSAAM
jgi:signal transduction histidine kinase/ActR/RegA family two-component response regulator